MNVFCFSGAPFRTRTREARDHRQLFAACELLFSRRLWGSEAQLVTASGFSARLFIHEGWSPGDGFANSLS